MTLAGRFILFGGGGGGIKAESEDRLASVCVVEVEAILPGLFNARISSNVPCDTKIGWAKIEGGWVGKNIH